MTTKRSKSAAMLRHVYHVGWCRLYRLKRNLSKLSRKEFDPVFLKYLADRWWVNETALQEHIELEHVSQKLSYGYDDEEEGIHYSKKLFPMPSWAVDRCNGFDRGGLIEDTCEHGVGHPNAFWLEFNALVNEWNGTPERSRHDGTHGCDGCCRHEDTRKRKGDPPWRPTQTP